MAHGDVLTNLLPTQWEKREGGQALSETAGDWHLWCSGKAEKLVLVREMVLSHLRSQSDSSTFILSQCFCIWCVLLLLRGGLTVLSFLSFLSVKYFFLTCRKSWLGLSWFEMIQMRLKMANSFWSQRNQIDRHQFISHMSKPPCSFRRLGDSNKCTSNTELSGLGVPLALLQLKLWDWHQKAAKLPPALHRLWQHHCHPTCGCCAGSEGTACWSCLSWAFVLKAGAKGFPSPSSSFSQH